MSIKNPRTTLNQRRSLRRGMTNGDAVFWEQVRAKQLLGLRVKRQYGIGPYILDFYIPKRKIAIEIDGGINELADVAIKDKNRDAFLVENGISVIRIENQKVIDNLEDVIKRLEILIDQIKDPICLHLNKGKDFFEKTKHTIK